MTRNFPLFNLDDFSSDLMKSGARLLLLASLMVLAGCSEDKDFNTDKKTADFTEQNFKESALGVVQAALMAPAHIPFFNVLSESALPDGIIRLESEERDENERIYQLNCAEGGTARFTFNPVSGNAHPVGNKVKIEYRNCDHGDTPTYVGEAEFTYTKFEGLAKRLDTNDTEECAAAIAQNHAELRSKQGRTLETINTYDVSGLELIFTPYGGDRRVQVRRIEPDLSGVDQEVVEDFRVIEKDEAAIIVLRDSAETNPKKLTTDGDVVYFVTDGKEQLQLCQSMYRTLSAKLIDFGIVRDDFSAYMNGTVTLVNTTENFVNYSGRISDDSDYSVRIEQGGLTETYNFEDITSTRAYTREHGDFSYTVAGYVDIVGVGKAQMETAAAFIGSRNERFFRSGYLTATGLDLNATRIEVLDDYLVRIEAAPDGSTNNLPFPTYSLSIRISWEDLLARDFSQYTED